MKQFTQKTTITYDAYDYAFYNQYSLAGLPILSPNSFSFNGGANPQHINFSGLLLGFVNSFREASATAISSDPHHLKVDKDEYVTASCATKKREVKYVIVDVTGKKLGKTIHREFFTLGNILCFSSSQLPNETACYRGISGGSAEQNDRNPFTDTLTTGCLHLEDGQCGFKNDPHTWVWCQPTTQIAVYTHTTLASVPGDVRVSKILLKGQEGIYGKGTEFLP